MLKLAFPLLTLSLAQRCSLDESKQRCASDSASACVATCSLYKQENSCKKANGCSWTADLIFIGSGTCQTVADESCFMHDDKAACARDRACSWSTSPCKVSMTCQVNSTTGGACLDALSKDTCVAQGPQCIWAPSCDATTRCDVYDTQAQCLAADSCYWMESVDSFNSAPERQASCYDCYYDHTNTSNRFLASKARTGQLCTLVFSGLSATRHVISVSAAPSGCSAGAASGLEGWSCSPQQSNTKFGSVTKFGSASSAESSLEDAGEGNEEFWQGISSMGAWGSSSEADWSSSTEAAAWDLLSSILGAALNMESNEGPVRSLPLTPPKAEPSAIPLTPPRAETSESAPANVESSENEGSEAAWVPSASLASTEGEPIIHASSSAESSESSSQEAASNE